MSYMELYLNYSILISNNIPNFIMGICDNLIDCNKILKTNEIAYMYRIPLIDFESGTHKSESLDQVVFTFFCGPEPKCCSQTCDFTVKIH